MVKSIITGPGFVASHLADLLLSKGEEVYITTRWTDNKQAFEHIKDKVKWIPMDLNDLSSCIKVIDKVKPDYIFHLGAQSYVPDSFEYPAQTIQTNTIGTLNLLEAVRIVKGKPYEFYMKFDPVIHVCSSSEVYGQVDESDLPITEETKISPNNPYAVGKLGADYIALVYWKNYGLKIIRTRMFTHTGPRRVMLSAEVNFAKQIAEFEKYMLEHEIKFDERPIFTLKHGNLNSLRTWADVRDACEAYYLLVRSGKFGEVYNIGGDTVKSIGEMLDYLINLSPLKNRIIKQLDKSLLRKADVTAQIVDTSKFKRDCNWQPKISFEQTMQDLLNWWRQNV